MDKNPYKAPQSNSPGGESQSQDLPTKDFGRTLRRLATGGINPWLPATLLSLFISIWLFGYGLLNVREMAKQGPQGSAAVGFPWLTVIWFFVYVPLTLASLIGSARKWRPFVCALLVALFPCGMMWVIEVIVRYLAAGK